MNMKMKTKISVKNKYRKKMACTVGTALMLLTGCWDNIEPESRGFVVTLGIDRFDAEEDRNTFDDGDGKLYTVTMELPDLEALTEKSSETGNDANKQSSSETLSSALYIIDAYSSKKMYYGHTKVAVIGGEILADSQLFQSVVDALERNKEISRKVLILGTPGRAADIVNTDDHEDSMVGMFISNFYKKNRDTETAAFKLDLDGLSGQLIMDGSAVIPAIQLTEDGLKMSGAAVMKDFALQGWLDDVETRGLNWMQGTCEGAQMVIQYEEAYLPLKVNQSKTKIQFYEENNRLTCDANIEMEGSIEEFRFGDTALFDEVVMEDICALYELEIAKEISHTFDLFQREFGVDGYGFQDYLRKFHYNLYQKYGGQDQWAGAFEDMTLNITVETEIKSTGALK